MLIVPVVSQVRAASVVQTPAVQRIAVGDAHSCAIASNDSVWCWGDNTYGQLGSSAHAGLSNSRSTTPVQAAALPGGRVARTITSGKGHVCVLADGATVWCWGSNSSGQVGVAGGNQLDPVQVTLPAGARLVAAGGNSTCALLVTDAVMCWGRNNRGQLGNGTTGTGANPTPSALDIVNSAFVVEAIELGAIHACAVSTAGDAWCWGAFDDGRLGINTGSDVHSPQKLTSLAAGQVEGISAGSDHTCARVGPAMQCFGGNTYGQLGADPATTSSSVTPTIVSLGASAVAVAAGTEVSCVVEASGGLECLGADSSGQLASGTIQSHRFTAGAVTGISGTVVDVAVGDVHSCAVLATGAVRCWGANTSGQLGDGSRLVRTAAVAAGTIDASPTTTTTTSTTSSTTSSTSTSTTTTTVANSTSTTLASGQQTNQGIQKAMQLRVKKGRHLTARAIAAHVSLAIPKTSQGTMRLSIVRGARSCAFAGARVRGVRAGTCTVLVTLIPKRGKRTLRTATIVVS
jgi:alpha-tubulin suppressor-like RCC1 family protein